MEITIPFSPRDYQRPLNNYILGGGLRAVVCWHRRAGKDLDMWNLLIRKASQRVGLYYYFLPTYTQGKKIIWEGITNDGMKFLNFVPEEMIDGEPNSTELKLKLLNGSMVQIIGTDNYDAVRGTNPIGCVFSEYAYQNPMAWEVIRPILKVNNGWAIFNSTPNGKNHFFEMFNMAKSNPDWFCEKLSIKDTGILTHEDMEAERREGMTEEMIQQEYYCSFDIGAVGSYYGKQIQELGERVCAIPVEPLKETNVYLDLGKDDATAVVFTQQIGKEIRLIDYYEASHQDIEHYAQVIQEKGYKLDTMWLPHDAFAKRLESPKTIAQQFEGYGFKVRRVPSMPINAGIQLVRKYFPQFWIDKTRCAQLIRALENYRHEYDEVKKVFRDQPLHDWSSHCCDSVRYMCIALQETKPASDYKAASAIYTGEQINPLTPESIGYKNIEPNRLQVNSYINS